MSKFSTYYIKNLKKHICIISGLSVNVPSECKWLATMVFDKTQKQISETTIKRMYGFAFSRFDPSLFTLDTLAKYCNYSSWDDFLKAQNSISNRAEMPDVDWDTLKASAHKMTDFTMQALKGRSGISYTMTIKRKFIDDHFEAFLNSRYNATVFVAPVGYGKTLALCRWIDERMTITGADDVILFFSSNAMLNVHLSGRDLNGWLLSLMGYSTEDDFATLLKTQQQKKRRFFLMVDGVDEILFKQGQFRALITQLMDIISIYQLNDCFKFVLTMRSSTWINNSYSFEKEPDIWFLGDLINHNPVTNVPLLNIREITELSAKSNLVIHGNLAPNLAKILSHPLYFQIYHKQYKANFNPKSVGETAIYKLIFSFIADKLYAGPYATEKFFLTKEIIKEMDLSKGKFKVDKCRVIDLIKKHNNAYLELLSIGFFQEVNTRYNILYKTNIEFGNIHFLEFSIAKTLLFNNNDLFDKQLTQNINRFLNMGCRLGVIKWYLIYAVKMKQYGSLYLLSKIELTANDKIKIISFLSDLVNDDLLKINNNDALTQYFNHDCNQDIFDFHFGLELITLNYQKPFTFLLKHQLSNKRKILLFSNLAIMAVIRLDLNELESYINRMGTIAIENYLEFAINPLKCLRTIFFYLKYGVIKDDCFKEITQFCFNPPVKQIGFGDNLADEVLYLIGVITLKIYQNPQKTIRFIQVVDKHYRNITDIPNGYNFLFKVIMLTEYLCIGKKEEAVKIYQSLQNGFDGDKNQVTPFMESLFNAARIIIGNHDEQYAYMTTDARVINLIVDKLDANLFKVYVQAILLKDRARDVDSPAYKQILYDYKKAVRQNQLYPQLFLENQLLLESQY